MPLEVSGTAAVLLPVEPTDSRFGPGIARVRRRVDLAHRPTPYQADCEACNAIPECQALTLIYCVPGQDGEEADYEMIQGM